MRLKPGLIVDVGEKEGTVYFNKEIQGHECVAISFENDEQKMETGFYEVFEKDGNITVKKLEDENLIADFAVLIAEEMMDEKNPQ